jgi:molecular chaperone Hsp33
MIKKQIDGMTKKEQLKARAKDRLHSFVLADGQIRGAIVHATHIINEMRLNHQLGILETLVLGHAYMGISLMTSNIKKGDRIAFKIQCSGPIKGLSVEANAHGEVRGYLKTNPIPIDKPLESFDLSPFFGTGFIEVIHYPEYAKQPYVGQVKLEYRRLAADLANYYLTSEQTPTSFNLSIRFDQEGNVTGAGGLLLQAMPDAEEENIAKLEPIVQSLPSIGDAFSANQKAEEFISGHLAELNPKLLANRRVEFYCHCQKDTVGNVIANLDKETLEDIAKNGPFPLESICHNCNTIYQFERGELEELYKNKFEILKP